MLESKINPLMSGKRYKKCPVIASFFPLIIISRHQWHTRDLECFSLSSHFSSPSLVTSVTEERSCPWFLSRNSDHSLLDDQDDVDVVSDVGQECFSRLVVDVEIEAEDEEASKKTVPRTKVIIGMILHRLRLHSFSLVVVDFRVHSFPCLALRTHTPSIESVEEDEDSRETSQALTVSLSFDCLFRRMYLCPLFLTPSSSWFVLCLQSSLLCLSFSFLRDSFTHSPGSGENVVHVIFGLWLLVLYFSSVTHVKHVKHRLVCISLFLGLKEKLPFKILWRRTRSLKEENNNFYNMFSHQKNESFSSLVLCLPSTIFSMLPSLVFSVPSAMIQDMYRKMFFGLKTLSSLLKNLLTEQEEQRKWWRWKQRMTWWTLS